MLDCSVHSSSFKIFMACAGTLLPHQNNTPIVLGREELIT